MQINVTCPHCESTYHLDPSLKGKRIRCPNSLCRAIFEVQEFVAPQASLPQAPPPAPPPAKPPTPVALRTGKVGEVVPVLPTVQADSRTELDDFFADSSPVTGPEPSFAPTNDPVFSAWEDAPPVRPGLSDPLPGPQANGVPALSSHSVQEFAMPEQSPRRGRWILGMLAGLTFAVVGASIWLVTSRAPVDEAERLVRAEKEYDDHNFGEAAGLFRSLVQDFPQSEQRANYQFRAELCDIRDGIHRTQTDGDECLGQLDRFNRFIEVYPGDPLVRRFKADISESLYRLVEELTVFARADKKRSLLEIARRLSNDAGNRFQRAPLDQAKSIEAAFNIAEAEISKAETRERILAKLRGDYDKPTLDAVVQARILIQQDGLAADPEIKALADALPKQHRKSIQYDAGPASEGVPENTEDGPPSLTVVLYHGSRPSVSQSQGTRPIFVLDRGVLYAHDTALGAPSWARRVGVDTTALPLWLPATAVTPPMVLIASTEAGGLLALSAIDGRRVWCQGLPEPCAGQPLLIGNRVLVACRDGAVVEMDALSGRLVGSYHLGLPLRHGGVRQPGTDFVYFAADQGCVFVLDIAQRQCAAILYTGHPSGTLHCPPVILPMSRGDQSGPPPAQLLLCRDNGQQGTDLLSYVLPIADPHAVPTYHGDPLEGRTWYPPLCTPEHFSLATDAGKFAVFGLRQRDNRDPEVFPMLRESLFPQPTSAGAGRPMAVHSDEQNFWILAQGRLHHFQIGMTSQDGWKIVGHPLPIEAVGSELQAAQIQMDDQGRTILFLVTESPNGRARWVSAVDLDQNSIRWQRQVGFVASRAPLAIPNPAAAGKTDDWAVLAWDRGGDLLLFDPHRLAPASDTKWRVANRALLREQPGSTWLFSHMDGRSVIALAVHSLQARIWEYRDGTIAPKGKDLMLESPVSGTPALVGNLLALPLANGMLSYLSPAGAIPGGEWRSPQADKSATCHAVAVGPSKLVCTNGSHGLALWQFDRDSVVRTKAAEVGGRIISAPAVLPAAGNTPEFHFCIADNNRRVTLLHGDSLAKVREWTMSDAITAGPFIRGNGILLVIGERRLVWLDPHNDKPRWAHTCRADIVGEPLLIDGVLIVADESGQIEARDCATGQAVGLGYTLRAAVAPAAAPLPYGTDRLFVPLTDGTVLLPSRAWFRPTLLGLTIPR
jgi:hypothetical protein